MNTHYYLGQLNAEHLEEKSQVYETVLPLVFNFVPLSCVHLLVTIVALVHTMNSSILLKALLRLFLLPVFQCSQSECAKNITTVYDNWCFDAFNTPPTIVGCMDTAGQCG